jgi:hypothetical protein
MNNTMSYLNTKNKKLIELDNGRYRVEWKGGGKVFISKYHAQQYILQCEEYKQMGKLNSKMFDNGILKLNNFIGIGEETIVNYKNQLQTVDSEHWYDGNDY